MAYTSDTALLTAVRDAIQAIVERGARSYTVALPGGGSRTFTALELNDLRKMEADLVQRTTQASRGSFGVAVFRETGR